jgi:hypothetical protein
LLKSTFLPILKRSVAPVLLGLLCLLIYNANLRQIGAGDTLPARYLPLILWRYGTLDLDANTRLVAQGHPVISHQYRAPDVENKVPYFEPWTYWTVRTRNHHLASLYPVVAPVMVAPLYYPAVAWLDAHGWKQPNVGHVAEIMEKLSASILASIASILMYLVLRRECGRWTLPLTLAFAFGTNTWMISSQALWQHGAAEVLIALAMLLVVSKTTTWRTVLLGAVCVLIAANRPPDTVIAGAIVCFMIWRRWRDALWLLAGGVVPLAAVLYYNLEFVGHIAGGYALAIGGSSHAKHLGTFLQPGLSGVGGLLVSPTRGLLVFTPFLVFLPLGLIQRLRSPGTRTLALALSVGVAVQILAYSQMDWRAGESWGPRWLTDILPVLVWLLAPAVLVLRPFARGALVLTMVMSVAVQVIGAFWYTRTSDELVFAGGRASLEGAWNPRNIPFLVELRHPPAPPELLFDARGSIDRVGAVLLPGTGEMPKLESGAVLEGWALTGGRSPAQMILLVDGVVVGSTTEFLPRADVSEAMQTRSPSGWRAYANTNGIAPGKRVLQLAVRIHPKGQARMIGEMKVMVVAQEPLPKIATTPLKPPTGPELEAMAMHATSLLRKRQSEPGYWLTAHTARLHYEAPQPEMNTYLTAVLVDLLSPIAQKAGIEEMMGRARKHLSAQIEDTGLVRYHGLPDGPTIGTMGHVITPDADDTALAWRIAGPGPADPRRERMLSELARYRDVRGLYRTWLAPLNNYQGLDPGNDPNPTDICIQMHVYLMLLKFDPPAAQKLGRALERSIEDGDMWVYYAKAPLIPYLRSVELRLLGCPLPVPTERLALPSAGQEIWSEAARTFVAIMESPQDATTREAARHLLGRIGHDNFAQIRVTPPMLYHNDLSATVKRYYWSEDFGYALWLRIYEAAGLNAPLSPKQSR